MYDNSKAVDIKSGLVRFTSFPELLTMKPKMLQKGRKITWCLVIIIRNMFIIWAIQIVLSLGDGQFVTFNGSTDLLVSTPMFGTWMWIWKWPSTFVTQMGRMTVVPFNIQITKQKKTIKIFTSRKLQKRAGHRFQNQTPQKERQRLFKSKDQPNKTQKEK